MSNTSIVKTYFHESVKAIAEARTCIYIAIALYCCAIFVGWTYADNFSFLEDQVKKLAAQFAGKNAITFIFKIFLHNLIATYVAMCFVVLFGAVPTVIAVFNGLILGWVIARSPGGATANIWLVLIPHGIFEWPAMLIAWGVGLWRGVGYRFSETGSTWKAAAPGRAAGKQPIRFILPSLCRCYLLRPSSKAAIIFSRKLVIK
jgi:uncharacterized membrane protein SpoIIM required for sporulation